MDEKITGFIETNRGFFVFTTDRIFFIKKNFLGDVHFDTIELYRKLNHNLLTISELEARIKKIVILKEDIRNIEFKKNNFLKHDEIIINADKKYILKIMETDFSKFKLHLQNKIEPISAPLVQKNILEVKNYFTSFVGQIGTILILTGIGFLLNFLKEHDPNRKWGSLIMSACFGFIGWYIYHKRNKWL